MQLLRADADFRPEAELCTVGEGGRNIGVDAGGVHLLLELADGFGRFADDALAVLRTVTGDVREGFLEAADCPDGHFVIQKLRAETLRRCRLEQFRGVGILERVQSGRGRRRESHDCLPISHRDRAGR